MAHDLKVPAPPRFRYETLPERTIRLFKLDIDTPTDSQLSGKLLQYYHSESWLDLDWKALKHASTSTEKEVMKLVSGTDAYQALSYTWGNQAEKYPLYLSSISSKLEGPNKDQVLFNHESNRNGILEINVNLNAALQELRRSHHNRFIWIDAICINQADDSEKTLQIPMMRGIYAEADLVYVWLGEGSAVEKGALTIMPNMTKILQQTAASAAHELDPTKPSTFEIVGLPDSSHPIWLALGGLMSRPWWSRLWTLQEAVMPEPVESESEEARIEIICGTSRTPWHHFNNFALAVSSTRLKDWIITGQWGLEVNEHSGFDGIREVRTCRESLARHGWAVSLSALLLAIRGRRATVPADMVFGMLAMLDRHRIKKLGLDVSMSAATVFVAFGKHYIRNEPKEILLNHTSSQEKLEGLPSWCPNFASPEETICMGTRSLGHFEESSEHRLQMYHAGFMKHGKWKKPKSKLYYPKNITNAFMGRHPHEEVFNTNNPRQIALVPDSDFILASGFHIDTVVAFVDCNPATESAKFLSFNAIQQTLEWESACLGIVKDHVPLAGVMDNYARTLVANRLVMEPSYNESRVFDVKYEIDFKADYFYLKGYMQRVQDLGEAIPLEGNLGGSAFGYSQVMKKTNRRRRFFVTAGGRMGLGPSDTRVGDQVCMLFFCPTPYLLRAAKESRYSLVGETYVHGIMYGEALQLFDDKQITERQWVIE